MARRKQVLKAGDLFELCVSDGRFGYGVIARPGVVFSLLILNQLYSERPSKDELVADDFVLIGATTDSFFYHDRWNIIAHDFPLPTDIPYPNWKVGIGGELRTTDFEGKLSWPISSNEVDLLDYKFSVSPVAFHKALEALNGMREWNARYEKLTLEYARRRVTRPYA